MYWNFVAIDGVIKNQLLSILFQVVLSIYQGADLNIWTEKVLKWQKVLEKTSNELHNLYFSSNGQDM
jgi:hypothetical protein